MDRDYETRITKQEIMQLAEGKAAKIFREEVKFKLRYIEGKSSEEHGGGFDGVRVVFEVIAGGYPRKKTANPKECK